MNILLQTSVIVWATIMVLVLIAFRRSAMKIGGSGVHHIMAGVFWIITASLARGFFWDIAPMIVTREVFYQFTGMFYPNTWPNIFFHMIQFVAGMRLMYGFWLMLPEEDRKDYNIITAAFYPKKLRMIVKEK